MEIKLRNKIRTALENNSFGNNNFVNIKIYDRYNPLIVLCKDTFNTAYWAIRFCHNHMTADIEVK